MQTFSVFHHINVRILKSLLFPWSYSLLLNLLIDVKAYRMRLQVAHLSAMGEGGLWPNDECGVHIGEFTLAVILRNIDNRINLMLWQ